MSRLRGSTNSCDRAADRSGTALISVNGRVDAAVGPAKLDAGLQDDGRVANVGGNASLLAIACRELASTVVDPGASDLAGGRQDGHGHYFDGNSTDGD